VWGRVHKELENRNLNGYLLETTVNFKSRNYAFSRMELVDKDELFPNNPLLPSFALEPTLLARCATSSKAALAVGGGRRLYVYSKPTALDSAYGQNPVSFRFS